MFIKVSIHLPHVPGPILKRLESLRKLQHLWVASALVKTLNFPPFTLAMGSRRGYGAHIKLLEAFFYAARTSFVHADTKNTIGDVVIFGHFHTRWLAGFYIRSTARSRHTSNRNG